MTTNRRTAQSGDSTTGQQRRHDEGLEGDPNLPGNGASVPVDAIEAILRQVAALRANSTVDEQLAQLVRIVDSATWSAPVPMTVLVDGTLLQGLLVPSEVSAAFLDAALRKFAQTAVDELEHGDNEVLQGSHSGGSGEGTDFPALHQARGFLRRVTRRPFGNTQERVRERNAKALMALNDWHRTRGGDVRLTLLDLPGSYADPASIARDVVPYTAGQRALTLADVKMMVSGEWLALRSPMRVDIGRIGAWSVDL
jgi:hypothetical protein